MRNVQKGWYKGPCRPFETGWEAKPEATAGLCYHVNVEAWDLYGDQQRTSTTH